MVKRCKKRSPHNKSHSHRPHHCFIEIHELWTTTRQINPHTYIISLAVIDFIALWWQVVGSSEHKIITSANYFEYCHKIGKYGSTMQAVWLFGKPHWDAMVSSTNIIAICHCIAQYTDTHRTLNRIKFIFPSMQWLMQTSCGFKVRANHQKYFTSPTSCRCDFCAQCGLLYIYQKPKLLYSVVRSFTCIRKFGFNISNQQAIYKYLRA